MGRNKESEVKRHLKMSMVGFGLSAGAVLLLAAIGDEEENWKQVLMTITGILFWLGFLIGCAFYVRLFTYMKDTLKQWEANRKRPSCLQFFYGRYGKVNDAIWIVTLGMTIFFSATMVRLPIVETCCLCLFVLTTYYHFIITGKVFRYLYPIKEEERTKSDTSSRRERIQRQKEDSGKQKKHQTTDVQETKRVLEQEKKQIQNNNQKQNAGKQTGNQSRNAGNLSKQNQQNNQNKKKKRNRGKGKNRRRH